MSAFIPDPTPRGQHAPYKSMWITGPVAAVLAWGLTGIGLAAWIWWKAPLIDNDRPDPTHLPFLEEH